MRFGNWFAGSISVVTKDYCTGNRCIVDVIRCDEEFVLRRDAVRSQVIGALEAQEISIGTYGTVALAELNCAANILLNSAAYAGDYSASVGANQSHVPRMRHDHFMSQLAQ